MTKIAIEANPSGTGTFTIAAPNSNTNRTFALPDTAGGLVTDAQVNDGDNLIINGAFDFWQRGTSSTSSGYVAADRWQNSLLGGTVTQSRQSHTVGDKFGVNSPAFYLRQTVSGQSLASHLARVTQKIEGVRSYAGETITVLGWVRRSSGSGNIAVEVVQVFGTGGSPSAAVLIAPQTITLTPSWEPFAAVITVPSITGKTLGTNGDDHLELDFYTSAGSDFNARTNSLGLQTIGVDLWGIHIKRGTHTAAATEFYKAPELAPELARCQRYYETGYYREDYYYASAWGATKAVRSEFSTTKRANPTMEGSFSGAGWTGTWSFVDITTNGFGFRNSSTPNTGAFTSVVTYTADAEL